VDGQVRLKSRDGRIFVIRPETSSKTSPLDVRSVKLPISRAEMLEAIREGRERFS
jgi:hypothetical protein